VYVGAVPRRRRRSRRIIVAILGAAVVALMPGIAAAKSYEGTIATPTVSVDGRTVSAAVTMTAFCDGVEYCGFFPEVTTVPDTQACKRTLTDSSWVGAVSSPPLGTIVMPAPAATAYWSEDPTRYSGGKRACLYAMVDRVLVAETTYQVPAPQESLSRSEAIGVMRRYMKRKYGHRWTRGGYRVTTCRMRSSAVQLRCSSVWRYERRAYAKTVVITERDGRYTYNTVARRPSAITTVTGTPNPSTRVGRSRRSQCDTRSGSVEMMTSSNAPSVRASRTATKGSWSPMRASTWPPAASSSSGAASSMTAAARSVSASQ
jgi:hypothetical protein